MDNNSIHSNYSIHSIVRSRRRGARLAVLVIALLALVMTGLPTTLAAVGDDPRHPPEAGPIMSGAEPSSEPSGEPEDYPDWHVELVAHRGLSPGFPENTLAAFQNSIDLGVDVIEIDLRGTSDGEVVVLHDATVDRTTNGTGDVTEMTLEEVKDLDAGSWYDPAFAGEEIPTYEEVLDAVSGTGVKLLLDIKLSEVLDKERIVRLTEQHGATLDVIVGVRDVPDLQEFRELNPNLRTLGFIPSPDAIEEFADANVDMIRLWPHREGWIYDNPGLIEEVHDLGLPVWATANVDPYEDLDQLIQLGVNGLLTDLPEVMALLQGDIAELQDPDPPRSPKSKDECKDGGWREFNDPPFSNQGECVSYVQAN